MSDHDDDITLRQILDHAREASDFVREISEKEFLADRLRYLAVTRLVSIVGEAATRLTQEKRDQLSQVPWRQIIGFRNILIHLKVKTLAEKGDWLRALNAWYTRGMLRLGACPPFQRTFNLARRQKGTGTERIWIPHGFYTTRRSEPVPICRLLFHFE